MINALELWGWQTERKDDDKNIAALLCCLVAKSCQTLKPHGL